MPWRHGHPWETCERELRGQEPGGWVLMGRSLLGAMRPLFASHC